MSKRNWSNLLMGTLWFVIFVGMSYMALVMVSVGVLSMLHDSTSEVVRAFYRSTNPLVSAYAHDYKAFGKLFIAAITTALAVYSGACTWVYRKRTCRAIKALCISLAKFVKACFWLMGRFSKRLLVALVRFGVLFGIFVAGEITGKTRIYIRKKNRRIRTEKVQYLDEYKTRKKA